MGRSAITGTGCDTVSGRSVVPAPVARIVLLCILTVAWTMPAPAALYYIKPDGTGTYPTIQAAIDAATAGDVIALADGTFTGSGNRDLTFLGKAITVRSYTGDAKACIIDCEYASCGLNFYMGEGPSSRLEGITITHGSNTGGGAINASSSPTIVRVIFRENGATDGGAIYT